MNDMERKEKIYAELIEEAKRLDVSKHDGEFTVSEFAEDCGITRDAAHNLLQDKVKRGVVSIRKTAKSYYYRVI